jgi:uncharacterized protein YcbK (DUF882 family)
MHYLNNFAAFITLLVLAGIPTFAHAHSRIHQNPLGRHHHRSVSHNAFASHDRTPRHHLVSRAHIHQLHGNATTSRSCLTAETRQLLERVEARFGPVQIVSTCRPGAVIAGTSHASMHRYGRAVDFNAPPGRKAEIVRWLAANNAGGTMTYASMSHIHMDTGPYHFVSLGAGGGGRHHDHLHRIGHPRFAHHRRGPVTGWQPANRCPAELSERLIGAAKSLSPAVARPGQLRAEGGPLSASAMARTIRDEVDGVAMA